MRFYGEYQHSLDSKGRVALPARFRKVLPEFGDLIITEGAHGALYVFTEEGFEEWVDKHFDELGGYKESDLDQEIKMRKLYAKSSATTIDSAGRINIPESKIKAAKLDRDVVIIGVRNRIEVWNARIWEEHSKAIPSNDELLFPSKA
ncbi:MAG: division/cell wall cluster transcriptional repressor MraZ [Actinobacteria bacterium]|nr:division/cell wall cluster transcriptional repressor MraZ [Actinomycetota bacterium]